MEKRKPYIAPKILYCDFDSDRFIGNDTDKINEIVSTTHYDGVRSAEESLFAAICPMNREIYSISGN